MYIWNAFLFSNSTHQCFYEYIVQSSVTSKTTHTQSFPYRYHYYDNSKYNNVHKIYWRHSVIVYRWKCNIYNVYSYRVLKVSRIFTKHSNVVTNFSCWQCLCMLLGHISLLYNQLLQYTLLKYFTVPSALLTKFPEKLYMKLSSSDITFTYCLRKHFSFDAAVFHLSIKDYCKTRPHRSYSLFSVSYTHLTLPTIYSV